MATHEDIVQVIRSWVREVRQWTDAEAADLVIPVDRGSVKGLRPAVPFLTVDLALFGQQVGTDEKKYAADGDKYTRGTRRGRVNIQGFGLETSDWLEELAMWAELAPSPLTVNAYGEIVDISQIAGTNIEARYSRDFDIAYALINGPRKFNEATSVSGNIEHDPDDDSIVIDFDVDLS